MVENTQTLDDATDGGYCEFEVMDDGDCGTIV